MTNEKQQFYSNAIFYNQLQNILDFCQENRRQSGSFAVILKYFVQMKQNCVPLRQAYELSKAACNSEIAAWHFEKWFKCVLV